MKAPGIAKSFAQRADELFAERRREIFRKTDELFAKLMAAQGLIGIPVAFLVSSGPGRAQTSYLQLHPWIAIFLGASLSVLPFWVARTWPGKMATRHLIAAAQMLVSALLIGLTAGRAGTEFHVLVSLVALSFYRDWRVIASATLVFGLVHFWNGINSPDPGAARVIEQGIWVLLADLFLVIGCLRSVGEMRSVAQQAADMEASEDGFRQIFDEAPVGISVVGLGQRYLRANARFCQMIGYVEQELKTLKVSEVTASEDLEVTRQAMEELGNGQERVRIEKRYVRKDGGVFWSEVTACVIRDKEGNPRHYLSMVEDITERRARRRAEALNKSLKETSVRQLNELETQRRALDQFAIVAETDARGIITYANDQFCNVSRYSREELLGKNHNQVVNSGYHDREFWQEFWATISAGNIWRGDICNRAKDGTNYWVDTTIVPRLDANGKPEKYLAIRVVITERKLAEEALRQSSDELEGRIWERTAELQYANYAFQQAKEDAERANHAKSEFLSRVSHELRTPLNAILGFGQLLERQTSNPTQRTRVGYITSAGRHLLDLINEVLDVSRIEAGHMDLHLESVSVDRIVAETLGLIRPMAEERSITITAPEALGSDICVTADGQRLVQVILNLLSNAVKYTPEKGKVDISCVPSGGDAFRISFQDTGQGIAEDMLARLFTPFDRLGAECSNVKGTGLGLALSERLMKVMGGSIGASSVVGQGSTFWIQLPRAETPPAEVSPTPEPADLEHLFPASTEKRKVLYIEDNLSNLTLVEAILNGQSGIELISAMQGKLGLDLARKHLPDLILLDLHLPDLPGWDVLAELQTDENTRYIPVVVISADATSRQIERLLADGARAYLTKPLNVSEFFRVVEENCSEERNDVKV